MFKRFTALVLALVLLWAASANAAGSDDDFQTTVLPDGTVAITQYLGKEAHVQIPETVRGYKVSAIESRAFDDAPVEKVRIPHGVTHIAGDAFAGCKNESSLQIMLDNHPVYATINGSLYEKKTRTLVIGLGRELVIPDGIVAIGDSACYGKTYESITLPDSVKKIGSKAFSGATVTAFPMGKGVEVIGDGAYANTAVKNQDFVLPASLTHIGAEAFKGSKWYINKSYSSSEYHTGSCKEKYQETNVIDVVIPASVTFVGEKAFAGIQMAAVSQPYQCTCPRGTKNDMIKQTGALLNSFGSSGSSGTKVTTENVFAFIYAPGCPAAQHIQAQTFATENIRVKIQGAKGQKVALSVGAYAFSWADVTFEPAQTVEITGLEASAFVWADVAGETEFVLADSVAAIPEKAFHGHGQRVKTIPESVKEIGDGALYAKEPAGEAIHLHAGLVAIGKDAFHKDQTFTVEAGTYAEQWARDSFAEYSIIDADASQEDDLSWLTDPTEEEEDLSWLTGDMEEAAAPIAPQKIAYEYVGAFSEGYAVVEREGKYGYIDVTGREVIPCTYASAYAVSQGMGVVYEDKEVNEETGRTLLKNARFINVSTGEMWPQVWQSASSFSEGLARVALNGKIGFINTGNEVVIDLKYDAAGGFSQGRAIYGVKKDGAILYGFIDEKGNEVIPAAYTQILTVFTEGVAHVMDGERSLVIDRNGKIHFETDAENTLVFSQELAAVKKDGKYGFVDKLGNLVTPMQWKAKDYGAEPLFANHRAPVLDPVTNKYGYINTRGEMVIKPQFTDAGNFENGYAFIWGWPTSKLIDVSGNEVMALPEGCGLGTVYENGVISLYRSETIEGEYNLYYGLMNLNGVTLAETVYDSIHYGDGYFTLLKDGILTILDKEGCLVY